MRANPDGSIVRIRDVARVELGAQVSDVAAFYNGAPSAAIGIYQAPGANAVAVTEVVRATLDDLAARFPDDLAYAVVYDTTVFVEASIEEVIHTLVEAFVLVAIVVFLFLGKLRTTLIPVIAVPVSLIGTFAVMLALGFSANTVSLLALVLAIGIVVDDAIVVVENVERVMEEEPHLSAKEATRKAMGEIVAPIIAITLVLLSVFVPVAFIPGISGQLFQQFAVAVSVSMVISAINALSLSPALCSVLLKPGAHAARGPMRYVMGAIDYTRDGYAAIVKRLVRVSVLSLVALAAVVVGTGALFRITPTGFLPQEDQGAFFVQIALPEGASLNRTAGGGEAGRADLERDARRRRRHLDHRPRFSQQSRPIQQRVPGGDARAVRGAPRAGASGRRHPAARPATARRAARRHGVRLQPAADHRPRQHRRLRVPAAGSGRPRRHRACAGHARRGGRGQPAARAVQRVQHVRGRHAAALSSTSIATRRRRWASRSTTCSPRCRARSAGCTSTTSTCSAAPGRSTSRPTRISAGRSTTCSRSMSATPKARWCRSRSLASVRLVLGPSALIRYNLYRSVTING